MINLDIIVFHKQPLPNPSRPLKTLLQKDIINTPFEEGVLKVKCFIMIPEPDLRKGSHSPVSLCGASTGLDWGDPFSLKKIDKKTIAKTDKNSLCQF